MAKILSMKERQFKETLHHIAGLITSYGTLKFKKLGIEKSAQRMGLYKYYKADYEWSQEIVKNYLTGHSDEELNLKELQLIFSNKFKSQEIPDVEYVPYVKTWEERSTSEQVQIIKEALDREGIKLIIPSENEENK